MAKMFSVLLFVSFSCLSEFGTTCAVYIEQNTTYRNDYGVSSKPTTTYIDDGGVSSEQTTTYIYDVGVSSKQTTTYIDDGGVSSDQTTTYIDDGGVSSEQTTTYIDNGGVSSEQTTTYIDDDGASSKPTTIYIDDGSVSSEQTMTYIDDDDVSSEQTTTYIDDGGLSSKQTTTYIDDGYVSSEQTTTYIHNGDISSEPTTTYIDHGGVFSEQTTKFTDDYGVVSEQTTTYIDDDNVSSEQTTNYMYNYGVSLKTDVEINSVEKIKYKNRMKCEIIDLMGNVLPSAYVLAYPVNKSGQSLLIWFYEFNYLSLTISKNCVSLALDMFLDKIIDMAYLQDYCPDGTFIQNIFCDSSVAYNVSYIKNDFPHFSNVQIYFTDQFDHCTAQFNVYLESENHLLTNADIYRFLTNETICWKYVFFTNIFNVEFSLKEISDDRINLKTSILPTPTSYTLIFVTLKHQSCKENFLRYIYWNGLHVKENDTYLLSIDNIITFNEENNCIQVRFHCPDRYNQAVIILPKNAVVYLETAVAVEVTIVNGFMLYIFLQKDNRTPVTLLLSALAISDTTAAILMTIPKCIAYQIYGNQIDYSGKLAQWYIFDYPQCIMYSFLTDLSYTFHFVSVLITTRLCLQKTAALLFPMWSKRHLSNTVSVVCSVCIVIFCFGIFSPILYHSFLMEEIQGSCCVLESSVIYSEIYTYLYTIVNGSSILACLIVIVCTVYIGCKLTIFRRNLPWTDSLAVQKRHRNSALTVVFICVLFVLSESMFIITVLHFTLIIFDINIALPLYYNIYQYTDLSLIIGFSFNFIIYIVMSRELRNKLRITVTNFVRCCKC